MKSHRKPVFLWTLRGIPYLLLSAASIGVFVLGYCLMEVL